MSGMMVIPPIIIPMMELPTAMIALGMLGFELVQGLYQLANVKTVCDVDHVLQNKSGLKIGLRMNKKGKLELLVDEDELREKEGIELKEFKNQFQQRYAYAKLVERLKAEGYTMVEEKEETNETIRLVVRRWR